MSESSPISEGDTLDVSSLRTPDQIAAAFATLAKEEDDVNGELHALLSQQSLLEQRLRGLSSSTPQMLHSASGDARKLGKVIDFTAKLAEGVAVKVRQLDLAKSRVSDCQNRVKDLIDLNLCSDGVKSAFAEEDYEQAAAHLHRFLAMDEGLLKLTASEMQDGTPALSTSCTGLDSALATLHDAEVKVRDIVVGRFDEAVKREDHASIERFFKIFPLINMHDEGLSRFSGYLCSKVADAARENLKQAVDTTAQTDPVRAHVIFADTLTLLFEGIARTVEIHQPIIETYYGPGRLLKVFSMLQSECDRQTDKILAEFRKKRGVNEKRNRVKEALYGGGMASGGVGGISAEPTQRVAVKDLDVVLNEMTLLQARSELYYKFVRKRVMADIEISTDDEKVRRETNASVEDLLLRCGLCHAAQDLLADYILLEDYYMSANIKKAMENDAAIVEGHVTSVMLDDVFFLLKKCIQRSITGSSVDGVCAVVNNACGVLEQDFCGLLQSRIKAGFPSAGYLDLTQAYNAIQTSFQQGKLQAGGDASERQKLAFLTALNNADAASDYVTRLRSSLDLASLVAHKGEHVRDKVENCLSGLGGATSRLRGILDQGMQQLRQSSVKPRVKPWMDEFVSHDIDDDQFADFEANDPFIQKLIRNLDGLLVSFKNSLTTNNYDGLVSILTNEVTSQLEKVVLKSSFSRLGGLLLDREVRSLVSFLSNVTTWSVRDKFSRLTQMSTVLNLETVSEMADIWGSGTSSAHSWKLSPAEVRMVLGLRSDFKAEEIKRLRL